MSKDILGDAVRLCNFLVPTNVGDVLHSDFIGEFLKSKGKAKCEMWDH